MRLGTKQASAILIAGLVIAGGATACSSSGTSETASASPAPSVDMKPNNVMDQDAATILKEAQKAAEAAASVKVSSSTQSEQGTQSFELTFTPTGTTGSMSQGASGSFEVIASGGTVYVKGDENFNKAFAGEAATEQLAGKWVAVPGDSPQAQGFQGLGSSKEFFAGLLAADGDLKKAEETKDIAGVKSVGLTNKDKGTLWIATTGEAYPMSIDPPKGAQGSMTFTDWNAPVTIEAPSQDEVVNLADLPTPSAPAPAAPESAPATP